METVSQWQSFGGTLGVFEHASEVCNCPMRFAVYRPPQAAEGPVPVVWYLSGLTCTWANVMEKGGIQRMASELGLMIVAPDTSPRGDQVPDDDAYDLGQGAGFYLTATRAPWSRHYRMDRYVTEELGELVASMFPTRVDRQGIMGHSMGGHGALTLHLKHPERFKSVSAFAPIVAPTQVPWGEKAFMAYLGDDRDAWRAYDATALVSQRASRAHILIDQGEADEFLRSQLVPEAFERACAESGQGLTLRRHPGYDHSYYFIATFMEDHLRHHAEELGS